MDDLIKKKIEYLLMLLEYENNKNNNLSTLVETAVEVIKENQNKISTMKLNQQRIQSLLADLDETQNLLIELQEKDERLNDEHFKDLLDKSTDMMSNIAPNQETKQTYDKIMNELGALSMDNKDNSNTKTTHISKIVETAIDIITHKENIQIMKERYNHIRKLLKHTIRRFVQLNKPPLLDTKSDNIKQLLETGINVLSHSKKTDHEPQSETGRTQNKNILVETAMDILSQSTQYKSNETNTTVLLVNTAIELLEKSSKGKQLEKELYQRLNALNSGLLNHLEINLDEDKLKDMEQKIDEMNKNINDIEREKDLLNNNNQLLLTELDNKTKNIQDNNGIITELSNDIDSNNNEINILNNTILERENQIKVGNEKIEKLQQNIIDIEKQTDKTDKEKNNRLNILTKSIEKYQTANTKLNEDLDKLKKEKEGLINKNTELENELMKKAEEKEELFEELEELKEQNKKNNAKYEENKQQFEEQIKIQADKIKDIQEKLIMTEEEKTKEKDELKQQLQDKDKRLLDVINSIKNLIPELSSEIDADKLVSSILSLNGTLNASKSNVKCATSNNLIGKIDNECLYFDSATNSIKMEV